ncbi:MAG: gamma-glutamyltransferase [Candidatus Latescibacterota bacterium]
MAPRDPHSMDWKAASRTGVVAGGGAAAVAAGVEILAQGGNAADAAVTTILALNVTDHGDCSIGGEAPLLIWDAGRREVKVLCGQGRAPLSQEAIDWYMAHGIPAGPDIKMAPVPSFLDLCTTTLQHYGTKSFAEAAAPAIALLDAGSEPWQPKLAATLRKLVDTERRAAGDRRGKLQAVSDRFYGRPGAPPDIAADLEAYYIEKGGFLRRADLAAHVTTIEDPVTVEYRGYTVCKCGPWTQGPYLCQALRLLEGFDLQAMGHLSADYVHVVVEAIKLAMADRDAYYGDPAFADVPLAALLSDAYTAVRRPLIDLQCAAQEARPGDPYSLQPLRPGGAYRPGVGGTSTCVVADRWGNVVAATPSANVPPQERDGGRTGVTYGDRLHSLNTTPGHPNCIQPGKRPRITLSPTLVLQQGRPVLAISVKGGDRQDQTTLNLLLDYVDFGLLPESAVTAPRFITYHHQDSFDPNPDREQTFLKAGSLVLGERVSPQVRDELGRRGHRVETRSGPLGFPVMLQVDHHSGLLRAAGDPAAGRHAGGLRDE